MRWRNAAPWLLLPDERLAAWVARIGQWESQLAHVFIYFNNDPGGYAIKNAKNLQQMFAN